MSILEEWDDDSSLGQETAIDKGNIGVTLDPEAQVLFIISVMFFISINFSAHNFGIVLFCDNYWFGTGRFTCVFTQ